MNFQLTPEQLMIQKVARQVAQEVCEPLAAEIDREHRFPREAFDKLTECGLMGVGFDPKYGGSGGGRLDQVLINTELAKVCGTTSSVFSIHQGSIYVLEKHGTEEQKQKYIRPLVAEGVVGAFALTEANAGSDAAGVQTVAVEDGDDYIINGTKCFITGGYSAEIFTVFASTDPSRKTAGLTAFIVEKGTPGFTVGKVEEKMGIRGSEAAELIFDNVRVPKKNIIGKINKGFKYAMEAIDINRITVAASQALGIAEGAFEHAVKYSKERVQFGKPIAKQQGIGWYLAEMKTRIEASRWLVYNTAWMLDNKIPCTEESCVAKLFASESARIVTERSLQIHGGYGYMTDYPIERMYRDAKITEIYEGTNEIQKLVIAREILK